MSKGPTPSLLSYNNGKIEKKLVQRVSNCHRCGKAIEKGIEATNLIKKVNGYNKNLTTCFECARKILDKTGEDLKKIRQDILDE